MGQRLLEFYQKAEEIGKIKAKMRLAMKTGIASPDAGATEDTPENIKKFQEALQAIEKEI